MSTLEARPGASGDGGRALFGDLIRSSSNLLAAEGWPKFATVLALKLLNLLATYGMPDMEERVLQDLLAASPAQAALLAALGRSRLLRHCLSLDSVILLLALKETRVGGGGGATDLDDPQMMQGVLEAVGVVGDVAAARLLSAKFRKATVMEKLLTNWRPTVLSDGDTSSPGHECYVKGFVLGWYFVATRHTAAVVDCHASGKAPTASGQVEELQGLSLVSDFDSLQVEELQGRRGSVEPLGVGPDGLPACFGTLVSVLSLLLDKPQGPRVNQAQLLLLSILALVEDLRFAQAMHATPPDPAAAYTIFCREAPGGAASSPGGGRAKPLGGDPLRWSRPGLPPVCALAQVMLSFLSSNIRLALEADLYLICLCILHRLLCYQNNWRREGPLLDCKQILDVSLRLLTYLSRPAVFKAGGPAMRRLAACACRLVNLLLAHGPALMAAKPGGGAGPGGEAPADYVALCYEVGRVGGSNRVFDKLRQCAAQAREDGPDGPEAGEREAEECRGLELELAMAGECGGFVEGAVEAWLAGGAAPLSPTMPDILAVVRQAAPAMPLRAREDLLNFHSFVEGKAEAKLASVLVADLFLEYNRSIQVLPCASD